jgi:ATP-dependent protease ClpP protease subunit
MKKLIFIIAYLLVVPCAADTFTNKRTGEVFQGYATQEKKGSKTIIRIGDNQTLKSIDLSDYDVKWNTLGRRNQIIILPIKNRIELECETKAFEKAIKTASNQGPFLILIEIDTPGGQGDLMKRICDAIISARNCRTVAFISGGEYGGAYSAGAIIALACDFIYMADGTAIGAASPSVGGVDLSTYGEEFKEKMLSASRGYVASLAEQNGRSGLLAKAMVDSNVAVLEVVEGGKTIFITPEDKKESQTVQRVWNKNGSLLTLTAAEAIQCGIANKILNDEKEIISEFGFEGPKIIHNQDTIKARTQFEFAKTTVTNLYKDVDYLRKDVSLKLAQYGPLDQSYHHTIRVVYGYYDGTSQGSKEISDRRKNLKITLLRALRDLSLKYTGINALSEANPDLHTNIEEFKKEINTIEVLHKNIRDDLLFEIPQEFTMTTVPTGQDVNRTKHILPQ